MIRTEAIVEIPNKVCALTGIWAIDTHVARFSTLLTRHAVINHFEVIGDRIFKFLHRKINLGGEHKHVFKLVDLAGAGLSVLIILALARGHLLNESTSCLDTQ